MQEMRALLNRSLLLLVPLVTAGLSNAQIVNQVDATLSHSFIVSSKTLPAGKYTFRMDGSSDSGTMTVTSSDGKYSDMFMVRQSVANTTPAHTELTFTRYGNKEFLHRIFESGNKSGVTVADLADEEKQLLAKGQKPTEHKEGSK